MLTSTFVNAIGFIYNFAGTVLIYYWIHARLRLLDIINQCKCMTTFMTA